ncbi:protein of unknown function [Granulicella rosea]|uniref:DUF4139 domain-containing protein n=1 Tax=Granulicella rosea TaxID=474952 RepID=A0A239IGR3_9BACT|nr:DUF4139 domain-containing protein [Granulicella rosea]SNS92751.1 protein of unknown function [Granulicella rosea]
MRPHYAVLVAGVGFGITAAAQTKPHPATAKASTATQLPVTRVALYKNGVGFFEHDGHVTGNQAVTIDFTTAQLNDVLQSLTAIDLNGGRISGAGYNSTTPLEQQLKSLPLALGADASDVDFYNAIRGARVEVHAAGATITGRLLSIDLRTSPPKEGEPTAPAAGNPEKRFVTVIGDSGAVRTLELLPTTEVRLLDTSLHTDVTRYLELLASTRNSGLRHLTLQDNGTGARDLRVSYISEVPIWKSTYRILFTDPKTKSNTQTATLQGWSVVDNTTGTDWNNVQLSLVAGAPQSFIQPLSIPYYSRRPEIGLPQEAQLTPQTHESGDANVPMVGVTSGGGGSGGGLGSGHGNSIGAVSGGNAGGGIARYGMALAAPKASMKARLGEGMGADARFTAAPPIEYEEAASQSIAPSTTTNAFDDFFEYKITDPITIRKNESALVPILQTKITAERVTLWSQAQPTPLRALWITNTSDLTLDRGSFSIVENGSFGGEGLLDPIHPAEKRLLSYAADQAIRVTSDHLSNSRKIKQFKISKGVIRETSLDVNEVEYLVHNAAPETRSVVIEHPVRQGWSVDSDPKPVETTATVNRFRIEAAPGQTARLHIGERHTNYEYIRLVDRNEDQIRLLIKEANVGPATLAALQPVFDLHHQVIAFDDQINDREAKVKTITEDQNRLRENLKALKGTAEERSLAKRYTTEMNAQEDTLATLHKELDSLRAERAAKDQEFQDKLEAVEIDETL